MTRGALARELRSFEIARDMMPDIPVFFTVFSPMTIAGKLSRGRIHGQITDGADRALIHRALSQIADDVAALSRAAIAAGADGVFFAHQDAGRGLMSADDFGEFVVTYDVEALAGARDGRFNILHLHGDLVRFHEMLAYPVDGFNWHIWETKPSANAALCMTSKTVVGGINRWSITRNDTVAIGRQIDSLLGETGDTADIIITPGCTIRKGFDPRTLHFIRKRIKDDYRRDRSEMRC